jgi:hypothetical protein
MRTYLPALDLELNFETDVGGRYALDLQAVGLREGEEDLAKPLAGGDWSSTSKKRPSVSKVNYRHIRRSGLLQLAIGTAGRFDFPIR